MKIFTPTSFKFTHGGEVKSKFRLLIIIASIMIYSSILIGQSRVFTRATISSMADKYATELWGDVYPSEPIPYYGTNDEIIAYHFTYALGQEFPEKNSLMEDCYQAFQSGDRKSGWGDDEFGNMVIGANSNMPVFIEYSKCLPKQYAMGKKLKMAVEKEIGAGYMLDKTYYLGLVNVWFCYTNGIDKKYINLEPYVQIKNEEEFKKFMGEKTYFWDRDEFADDWVQFLDQKGPIETGMVYHPGVERVPFLEWSYGCTPTAGAMMMCWWDNFGGAGKLVKQYGEVWDANQENIDYHVPDIQYSLKVHMETSSTGWTSVDDISDGFETVIYDRGYNCVADGHWAFWWTVSDLFDDLKTQINAGRPALVNIEDHSICGVGYNSSNKTIATHDPNMSSERIITRSMLESIFWVYLTSNSGSYVNLETPDGSYQWNGNGGATKETLKSNDFYEITWNGEPLTNSFVILSYHVEGAGTPDWIEIGPTLNDGEFIWHVPNINSPWGTSTEHARIKIDLYDEFGTYMASDGSYGNFNINAGGYLTEIYSNNMELTETNPDFFKVNLNNPTWSVLGIRDDNAAAFWYLDLFNNPEFEAKIAECHQWQYVNYIVMNGNYLPLGEYGVKPWTAANGWVEADIQWDNDQQQISTGVSNALTWTSNHVSKIYNIYLYEDDYYFELDLDSTSYLDLDMALFKWGGDNIFDMFDDEVSSLNVGFGVDESFHYHSFAQGNYGLCITSKNEETDDYHIKVLTPGRWSGAVSSDWHNASNWTSNSVPTYSSSVVIPSGCSHYPIVFQDVAYSKNVTIEAGASLTINNKYMNVYGDLQIYGELKMLGQYGELTVENSITWEDGSTANILSDYNIINCYRNWKFNEGTNAQIQKGTVRFVNTLGSYIICNSPTSFLNNVIIDKNNGILWYNVLSSEDLHIQGDLTINSGSTFKTECEKSILLEGSFTNHGHFMFDEGTFEFIGNTALLDCNTGDYYNNIRFASTSACVLSNDLYLNGDMIIDNGGLITLENDIYIGGSWYNNVDPFYFVEGSGSVIFGGNKDSYCYGEEFNVLSVAASGLYFPSGITNCNVLKDNDGFIGFTGGTFTANKLYSGLIKGQILITDGEINLFGDPGSPIFILADLFISGGVLNLYDGTNVNFWTTNIPVEFHMSGGVIDAMDKDIYMLKTNANLIQEITGGAIRTSGNFTCERTDFNPSGGRVELYGSETSTISCVLQSNLFDVEINKLGSKGTEIQKNSKSPESGDLVINNDLKINGDLIITSGSLMVNGNILTIGNDLIVNDLFIMNNTADVVNIGGNVFWNTSSVANVTEGNMMVYQNFNVYTGSLVQFGINNTLKFMGEEISEINNEATGTSFGKLEMNKTNHQTNINPSTQAITVNGNLTVYQDNAFQIANATLECNGVFIGEPNSDILVEDNAILHANTSLTLFGNIYLSSGEIYCHDNFNITSSGVIHLNGGSFICDRPYSGAYFGLSGDIAINDGIFEISNEGLTMGTSANIIQDGGTVKIGWGIKALNPGNYEASDGVLEFVGPLTGIIQFESSNYVHDLKINRSGTGTVNNLDNLLISNDLWVVNNQFNIGANDVTIGGDVTIESTGILKADNGDLYVEGDWTNNAGDAGFLEGYRTVYFEGSNDSHILTDETFSTLVVNKSGGQNTHVFADPNTTINFTGDLSIDGCSFRLEDNSTINITGGDIIINENAALFASPAEETNINLVGYWNNYNTTGYPFENGFYYGKSTVNFYTDSEAGIEVSSGIQEFYNLQITKGIEHFYPYADITVHNETNIMSGIWGQDDSGMTYTFMGDLQIDWQGKIEDYANNFVFAGVGPQYLSNGSGAMVNLGTILVQKNITNVSMPLLALMGDVHCTGSIVVDSGDFHIGNNTLECVEDLYINENGRVIAPGLSVISMGPSGNLTVNGGRLELVGDATHHPMVTSINGNYEFSVANQGLLTAVHAIFENMDANGVRIYNTGLVYGTNALSNCTFRNGVAGGCLLQINNGQDLIINGAEFPDNTWGGTYNVQKVFDQGSVTFTNVTGTFSGPAYENDPYNRIGWDEMIPGIWEGTAGHSWNDPNNWQHNLKPTATDDVYIPAGTDNDPWVATTDQFCNNVTIEAGASLRIYDEILTVYGSMIIYGNLKMDNASGVLNVGDHFGEMISWEPGSTDEITNGTINVYGNWHFKSGTHAQLGPGNNVTFFGDNRSYIYCDDDDASFGNMEINKTSPPKDFVYLDAGDTLRVAEDLYVFDGILQLDDGSYVNVGNEFYIDSGCKLSAIGSAASQVTVSGYPNYCMLEINNGATISAEYAIFEYLESNGLAINPTAVIDPLHPLNYCTFRNGRAGGALITIANSQVVTIDGAEFPPNSWGGTYNVSKQNDAGQITFSNVEGVFVGDTYEEDPYNRVDWPGVVRGIWTGAGNSLWNVLVNWKYQLKPTATDDVLIPAGCPHNPRVTMLPQECLNIEIEAGASLEVYNQTLTVHNHLINNGEIIMNHSNSILNVGNSDGCNFDWAWGSTSDITAGTINMNGNWYFQDGTEAQLGIGSTVNFVGGDLSHIYCADDNASFGNLNINKSGGSYNTVEVSPGNTIRVSQNLHINSGTLEFNKDTYLNIGTELNVYSGGTFNSFGITNSENTISGYPDYCIVKIDSGASIGAVHTTFEYLETHGVEILSSAIIDPVYTFNFCTFREGRQYGTLLAINSDQEITINEANFPENTWGGNYNITKTSNQGQVTFTNFTGTFSGEGYENDLYKRIDWDYPWYNMHIKVFLEGPYNSGQMNADLGNIPNSQPYDMAPWNYDGLENTPVIPADVVDWVLVELRDASNISAATSSAIIDRKAAFLRKDGYIKDLGGLIDLQFNKPINHNLYLVIWHRNHLGIMSAYQLLPSGEGYSYDFTILEDQVYGGPDAHKEIAPGVWGMISGDGDSDGTIHQSDLDVIWKTEVGHSGYLMGDYNLDNQVDNVDKNDIVIPNGGFDCQVPD